MDNKEVDYTKAFNNGYLLAKHYPELLNKITSNLDRTNSYCEGMVAGKEEFEIEKARNFFKKFDKGDRSDITKDKNKDDKGFDR